MVSNLDIVSESGGAKTTARGSSRGCLSLVEKLQLINLSLQVLDDALESCVEALLHLFIG